MGDKLPARLEFRESGEDAFFAAVVSEVNGDRVQFKLAPTYTLYMCCRYRISPAYREELSKLQRGDRLSVTVQKIANMVRSTVEVKFACDILAFLLILVLSVFTRLLINDHCLEMPFSHRLILINSVIQFTVINMKYLRNKL